MIWLPGLLKNMSLSQVSVQVVWSSSISLSVGWVAAGSPVKGFIYTLMTRRSVDGTEQRHTHANLSVSYIMQHKSYALKQSTCDLCKEEFRIWCCHQEYVCLSLHVRRPCSNFVMSFYCSELLDNVFVVCNFYIIYCIVVSHKLSRSSNQVTERKVKTQCNLLKTCSSYIQPL